MTRGAPLFLIWYASLREPTDDLYDGGRNRQEFIGDEDVMRMSDEVATPQALAARLTGVEQELSARVDTLEGRLSWRRQVVLAVVAALLGGVLGNLDRIVEWVRGVPG